MPAAAVSAPARFSPRVVSISAIPESAEGTKPSAIGALVLRLCPQVRGTGAISALSGGQLPVSGWCRARRGVGIARSHNGGGMEERGPMHVQTCKPYHRGCAPNGPATSAVTRGWARWEAGGVAFQVAVVPASPRISVTDCCGEKRWAESRERRHCNATDEPLHGLGAMLHTPFAPCMIEIHLSVAPYSSIGRGGLVPTCGETSAFEVI